MGYGFEEQDFFFFFLRMRNCYGGLDERGLQMGMKQPLEKEVSRRVISIKSSRDSVWLCFRED